MALAKLKRTSSLHGQPVHRPVLIVFSLKNRMSTQVFKGNLIWNKLEHFEEKFHSNQCQLEPDWVENWNWIYSSSRQVLSHYSHWYSESTISTTGKYQVIVTFPRFDSIVIQFSFVPRYQGGSERASRMFMSPSMEWRVAHIPLTSVWIGGWPQKPSRTGILSQCKLAFLVRLAAINVIGCFASLSHYKAIICCWHMRSMPTRHLRNCKKWLVVLETSASNSNVLLVIKQHPLRIFWGIQKLLASTNRRHTNYNYF